MRLIVVIIYVNNCRLIEDGIFKSWHDVMWRDVALSRLAVQWQFFCSRDCTTAKLFVNILHHVLVNILYRTIVLYDVFSLEFLTIPWNKALWDFGLIFNCFTYSFIGRYALKVIFENYVNNRKKKLCLFFIISFFSVGRLKLCVP